MPPERRQPHTHPEFEEFRAFMERVEPSLEFYEQMSRDHQLVKLLPSILESEALRQAAVILATRRLGLWRQVLFWAGAVYLVITTVAASLGLSHVLLGWPR